MNLQLMAIAVLASSVLAGVAGWTANGWRLNSKIDGMVAEHSLAIAKANSDALARYTSMEKKKQEAIDEANKIAKANAAAATALGLERDRLREQLSANTYGLSTASIASIRNYSATLSFILGECAAELEGLAKAADGHALDTRTLIQAWPR
jgi:hypothetical protein